NTKFTTAPRLAETVPTVNATAAKPATEPAKKPGGSMPLLQQRLDATFTTAPRLAATVPTVNPTAAKPATEPAKKPDISMPLLQQRLDATNTLFAALNQGSASIQLFYTEDANPARMARLENFLERANKLGTLDKIHILPIEIKNRGGYRILYGLYPSIDAASTAMQQLPQTYKEAYAPTLYIPNVAQTAP
ncbi:MAG TPA: SPOR domain-containing protein, partial [Gallionellaceae bacterium]|nr:SPOR domain-containing protein [Gallionellaceae bacterium]